MRRRLNRGRLVRERLEADPEHRPELLDPPLSARVDFANSGSFADHPGADHPGAEQLTRLPPRRLRTVHHAAKPALKLPFHPKRYFRALGGEVESLPSC